MWVCDSVGNRWYPTNLQGDLVLSTELISKNVNNLICQLLATAQMIKTDVSRVLAFCHSL